MEKVGSCELQFMAEREDCYQIGRMETKVQSAVLEDALEQTPMTT